MTVFIRNKSVYGFKKLHKAVHNEGISIGKVNLARIIKEEKLISKYVRCRKAKSAANAVNTDKTGNKVD